MKFNNVLRSVVGASFVLFYSVSHANSVVILDNSGKVVFAKSSVKDIKLSAGKLQVSNGITVATDKPKVDVDGKAFGDEVNMVIVTPN